MNSSSTQHTAGLYNANEYEVSFPFEESMDRSGYLNQTEHILGESAGELPPHYSPFMLVSNLRTHLFVALEKNSWLQKRIEDLEEERNFLRRQLDRFIFCTRTQEPSGWNADLQHSTPLKPEPVRSSTPSPPSPMTTRSGTMRKRLQSQPGTRRSNIPVKQEMRADEEEKYFEEDGYLEEEEVMSEEEDSSEETSKKRGSVDQPRIKMRRVFRITRGRERQRVKDPDGVLHRYQRILHTYQRLRSMSKAFQVHRVDRNTMASTSPIAELLLVSPEKVGEVGEFDSSKEKLLDYARRCYKALDEQMHAKVQGMKKKHLLLPITYRFRN